MPELAGPDDPALDDEVETSLPEAVPESNELAAEDMTPELTSLFDQVPLDMVETSEDPAEPLLITPLLPISLDEPKSLGGSLRSNSDNRSRG